MAGDDSLNVVLALSTLFAVKFAAYAFCKRKRGNFEYVGNVSNLNIYPVKSCRPLTLQTVKCTKIGMSHEEYFDRHWMVVKENGMRVNIQQEPKMACIETSFSDNGLQLDAPDMPTLTLEKDPNQDPSLFMKCCVQGISVMAMKCGKTASEWICQYLGKQRLYIVMSAPDITKRCVAEMNKKPWLNPPKEDDMVTFSEVGAYNIACDSSLADLNTRLTNPVAMDNFRPSIVVSGSLAFDEDYWSEIKIGNNVQMRVLEPNPRCLLTTVNKDGKRDPDMEPMRTLRKFRKSPLYGDSPLFGITTAIDSEGVVNVGDPVYVLYKR